MMLLLETTYTIGVFSVRAGIGVTSQAPGHCRLDFQGFVDSDVPTQTCTFKRISNEISRCGQTMSAAMVIKGFHHMASAQVVPVPLRPHPPLVAIAVKRGIGAHSVGPPEKRFRSMAKTENAKSHACSEVVYPRWILTYKLGPYTSDSRRT